MKDFRPKLYQQIGQGPLLADFLEDPPPSAIVLLERWFVVS